MRIRDIEKKILCITEQYNYEIKTGDFSSEMRAVKTVQNRMDDELTRVMYKLSNKILRKFSHVVHEGVQRVAKEILSARKEPQNN